MQTVELEIKMRRCLLRRLKFMAELQRIRFAGVAANPPSFL
jgi:hypothetical protein